MVKLSSSTLWSFPRVAWVDLKAGDPKPHTHYGRYYFFAGAQRAHATLIWGGPSDGVRVGAIETPHTPWVAPTMAGALGILNPVLIMAVTIFSRARYARTQPQFGVGLAC